MTVLPLAVLAAVTLALSPPGAHADGDALTVPTRSGPVRGKTTGAVRQFLGIPYAAPPVGALRFRAPQPAAPWTDVRDATTPGSACTQMLPVVNAEIGSEDCLVLNVYAPDPAPRRKAPVMVWIHGGGFTVGSGTDNDPTRLVARTGVVVVSVNYRLGAFGFLGHPALTAEDPDGATGNAGLQDQQAALRWVKDNVAAFGGNPKRITIFGESAGGMSVCAHLLSPRSKKLFRRAIIQSGPCDGQLPPRAAAEAQGGRLAATLGCDAAADVLACLRALPARDVLRALPGDSNFIFDFSVAWIPVADGVVLPADPPAALRRGRVNRVPLIDGVTRDEGRLFVGLAYNSRGTRLAADAWAPTLDDYFGAARGPQVRAQYPLADYPDPGAAFGQAVGDAILACPALRGAQALARHMPVYVYEFTHDPNPFILPMPGIALGAFHSAELPYVFAGPVQSSGAIRFTPDEEHLVDAITGAWTRFAATGRPGQGWPRWNARARKHLVLRAPTPSVGRRLKVRECGFWDELGWRPGLE